MKRAIIIGASSGMGMLVGRQLAKEGWQLGIAARRTDRLEQLKATAPERITVAAIDVTSDDAPQRLLALIHEIGGADLFFYASGIGKQNMALRTDIELQTVNTNALGFTRMIDTIYEYMTENGEGHIAVISSIAGTRGLGRAPSYSATKAFQNTYIEALEQQARMRGLSIAFTDIRPGFVDTDLLNDGNHYPLLMKPEHVAGIIMRAIRKKKHVCVIDWRWNIITRLWQLIPHCIWRRMKV
jgi:short-subunit dehydrogenase